MDFLYESMMKDLSEKVCRMIEEYSVPLSDFFDLENVPQEEIEYVLNNRTHNMLVDIYSNPLISESLLDGKDGKTYMPDFVIRNLKQKYGALDWQFSKQTLHSGKTCLIIVEPDKYTYTDEIIEDMDKLGYFLCRNEYGRFAFEKWRYMMFEAKEQPDIRTEIRKDSKIYHVTPVVNLGSILRSGILPKSSDDADGYFAFPERVYLMTVQDRSVARDVARTLFRRRKEKESMYAIIEVAIDSIPDNVHMFYDSCFDEGIFVRDAIHASAIKDIWIYSCTDGKEVKYGFWTKLKDKIKAKFIWKRN